jgi:hypothetical protein
MAVISESGAIIKLFGTPVDRNKSDDQVANRAPFLQPSQSAKNMFR